MIIRYRTNTAFRLQRITSDNWIPTASEQSVDGINRLFSDSRKHRVRSQLYTLFIVSPRSVPLLIRASRLPQFTVDAF